MVNLKETIWGAIGEEQREFMSQCSTLNNGRARCSMGTRSHGDASNSRTALAQAPISLASKWPSSRGDNRAGKGGRIAV